jgi:hypothetical protein
MPPPCGKFMENWGRNDEKSGGTQFHAVSARFLHGFSTKSPSRPINLEGKID